MKSHPSFRWLGGLALLGLTSVQALAAVTWLQADLDGTQSGTGSSATGKALVKYDSTGGLLSWTISWKDVAGTADDLHFHGPAATGVNAGVQVGVGTATNPRVGSATITPTQAADLLNGLWYVNLHTSDFPAGEIRGQVLPALQNYWPADEGTGTTTANTVSGTTAATLNGGVTWVTDATRGQVLSFDGAGGTYVDAARIGLLPPTQDFTWAFWSKTDPAQPVNNDIILGNRFPNEGWSKFTPTQFEYRDLAASFNTGLNYPDFTTGVWVHNAVVKSGSLFTYYRNGIALLNTTGAGTLPALTPLYFGGDPAAAGEGWQGQLDQIATWRSALPLRAVKGLADSSLTPPTTPLEVSAPVLQPIFTENFSGTLNQWNLTTRGLESNSAAGYDTPLLDAGTVILGGTTTSQYWFGSSIESKTTFDSRIETEVSVKRVLLSNIGTAGRSSLWIVGDAAHYLHFSQNLGENGWQYNARDDGGLGGLNPTGGGNNLGLLDSLDGDGGEHTMRLRLIPGVTSGSLNVEIYLDNTLAAVHGFTNFPNTFTVVLTGQARAIGDNVAATFDDVLVSRQQVANLPPVFAAGSYVLPTATAGTIYNNTLTGRATDPESASLTYTATGAPAWLSVAANGALSGTPGPADTGVRTFQIRVTDPGGQTADATFSLRIQEAAAPALTLTGWWPLNDGSGTNVRSVAGNAVAGTLMNPDTGGLGTNGSAWFSDPAKGTVLSFDGNDGTGSWVLVGSPPTTGNFPNPGLSGDFTLTCRVKSAQGPNNDIIIGNRFNTANAELTPRQFVKLTPSAFEWHWNGAGQNVDFPDLPQDVWMHLAVVKDGPALTYYRDGVPTGTATITGAPDQDLPLFFGGQGVENWRGYLSDVRLFSTALTDAQINTVMADTNLPVATLDVTSVSVAPDRSVTLTWPAAAGSVYSIWASTSLAADSWVEVADSITTGSYTVMPGGIPNTATEPRLFFQVRQFNAP
jgi:hypothetical protein